MQKLLRVNWSGRNSNLGIRGKRFLNQKMKKISQHLNIKRLVYMVSNYCLSCNIIKVVPYRWEPKWALRTGSIWGLKIE